MPYRIEIKRPAIRAMAALPEPARRRVDAAILALADNPRPNGCRKLAGEEGQWRIRVGDFRVIYQVRDAVLLVLVVRVGHRREVYRER